MDDVNYLRQNASEESFLFVVDSSRRDTAVYEEPNEYEVHFKAPFRNVIGMDLVDATVPRTAYLVDDKHNALEYTCQGARKLASVPPGDYNVAQLAEALTAALAADDIAVAPTSSPAEVLGTLTFTGTRPFTLHAATSSIRRAAGLGVADVPSAPAGLADTVPVVATAASPADVLVSGVVRQSFVAAASGTPEAVTVSVQAASGERVRAAIVSTAGEAVAEGSLTLQAPTILEGGVVCVDCAFTTLFQPGEPYEATVTLTPAQDLEEGRRYFLVVGGVTGVYASGPDVSRPVGTQQGAWWQFTGWTTDTDALVASVLVRQTAHRVVCPKMVDLTGEPYVMVRCPEIEQQLYRDRAFETVHAGMGMIKLGNYGFREQRFDFVSFPPRRLPTPIAKLHKLTIRLEKGDGTLYDTKGINHYLIMVIRYLQLTKTPDTTTSMLNPKYDPNPLSYLQRQRPV